MERSNAAETNCVVQTLGKKILPIPHPYIKGLCIIINFIQVFLSLSTSASLLLQELQLVLDLHHYHYL